MPLVNGGYKVTNRLPNILYANVKGTYDLSDYCLKRLCLCGLGDYGLRQLEPYVLDGYGLMYKETMTLWTR